MQVTREVGYTRGPWHISSGGRYVRYRLLGPQDTAYEIADLGVFRGTKLQYEANARLITAAPELLQALEDIITAIGPYHQDEVQLGIKRIAEAAIAKAEGRD